MTMSYRTLGGTGIEVSVHCLGAMMFGAAGNPDHADGIAIIRAALDQGINFVDTADMYSAGESEEIVGKALRGRRDDVVLATKVHFPMGQGPGRSGNSRRWIMTAVEQSLRRLAYYVARERGLHQFRTEQPPYSLLARAAETAVLPTCQKYGMGVLTWSPLAAGFLSGRYRPGQEIDFSRGRPATQRWLFDPESRDTQA
jgi:aryl-alcohol dehydrogenase-like predicted oxidoreductase